MSSRPEATNSHERLPARPAIDWAFGLLRDGIMFEGKNLMSPRLEQDIWMNIDHYLDEMLLERLYG